MITSPVLGRTPSRICGAESNGPLKPVGTYCHIYHFFLTLAGSSYVAIHYEYQISMCYHSAQCAYYSPTTYRVHPFIYGLMTVFEVRVHRDQELEAFNYYQYDVS